MLPHPSHISYRQMNVYLCLSELSSFWHSAVKDMAFNLLLACTREFPPFFTHSRQRIQFRIWRKQDPQPVIVTCIWLLPQSEQNVPLAMLACKKFNLVSSTQLPWMPSNMASKTLLEWIAPTKHYMDTLTSSENLKNICLIWCLVRLFDEWFFYFI